MIAFLVVGFVAGLAVRPVVASTARARRPVQFFMGRVFPHPSDDRWEHVGDDRYRIETVTVHYTSGPRYLLAVGAVQIADGPRVKRYHRAIVAEMREQMLTKALEAIP